MQSMQLVASKLEPRNFIGAAEMILFLNQHSNDKMALTVLSLLVIRKKTLIGVNLTL